MPKKKGKAKGKKGKGKGKSKKKAAEEKEIILKKTKDVLKSYLSNCFSTGSCSAALVINSIKQCIEEEKPYNKAVLDLQRGVINKRLMKGVVTPKDASTDKPGDDDHLHIKSSPLLHSLLAANYVYLRCIHLWQLQLSEDEMVELSRFMESKIGHEIRVLELIGNNISTWSLCRLARTFPTSQLVHITLDYNKIDNEGMQSLCSNLLGNLHLNSLNLNYCNLTSSCGDNLGMLVSSTQIRYLSIRGNRLRSEGVTSLVQRLASVSEANEGMPLLSRLFLQDNEIDGCTDDTGIFGPVTCMAIMKRWLISCKTIEEVRLDGNLLGDSAAREILIGLKCRKEAGYSPVQLSMTTSISTELFVEISSLTASGKGKKKGKRKGKKKK